jgi:hypothetical protein
MADQTLTETEFVRDMQAFVGEKWKRNPCERCGAFAWAIPENAAILKLKAETPPNPSHSFARYDVEFIPIYCENCGNTVVIYSEVFDGWRKNRGQAK